MDDYILPFKYIDLDGQIIKSESLKVLIDLFVREQGYIILELFLSVGEYNQFAGSDGMVYFKYGKYDEGKSKGKDKYWPLPVYQLANLKSLKYRIPKQPLQGASDNIMLSLFHLKSLQQLDITGDYPTISPRIGEFTNLTSLIVKGLGMKTLPNEFSSLKQLKILNISYCFNFSLLPPVIGYFLFLEELIVRYSIINSIPNEIVNLQKLKNLEITYSQLRDLPSILNQLNSLEYLNVEHNKLVSISPSILNLPNLEAINVSGNSGMNYENIYSIYNEKHPAGKFIT